MLQENRKNLILEKLKEKSFVTVIELSKLFGQSEVTVRKLLLTMENDGLLKRTWGGAVNASTSLVEYSHEEKETKNLEEKKAIALSAYNCINDGEAIFLDSGTTTMQLAKLIANGNKRHILVCTNALNLALEFVSSPDIEVVVVGGELRHKILCCTGSLTIEMLKRLYFDKCFVTGNHFTLEMGFTTPTLQEAEVKRMLMQVGKKSIVLMDYSKYGDNSLCLIAPITSCDILITDWRAPESLKASFAEKNVKMIIAPEIPR